MDPQRQRGGQWRWLAWGLAASVAYLVAGTFVWPAVPPKILYEGEAPPLPYRWVRPPANLPEPNQPPTPGSGTVALTPTGSQSSSVLTDDGQAALILRFGAIAPHGGASSVTIRITPLDPATVSPPPSGLRFDGNAYRMEGTYDTGGPIALLTSATPVLRYPKHATMLLRLSESGWTSLETHVVAGSLQLFGPTDRLGVFVAAAPPATAPVPWARYVPVAAAVAGVLAAIAALSLNRRRRPLPRHR
ncbi:MAG TPA: hypothetical protein VFP86_10480 [bacterium]|nr:hypothetical protein [bacterium]